MDRRWLLSRRALLGGVGAAGLAALLPRDARLDPNAVTAEQARTRLRATLAAHNTDGGVYFDSRAWIITARRH